MVHLAKYYHIADVWCEEYLFGDAIVVPTAMEETDCLDCLRAKIKCLQTDIIQLEGDLAGEDV